MKNRWLFFCVLYLTVFSGYAQVNSQSGNYDPGVRPEFTEKMTPEQIAKERTSQMKKELRLSGDTLRKVYSINLEFEKQYHEQLLNSPHMTDYDKAVLANIRKSQARALKESLTEKQWHQWLRREKEGNE